MISSLWNLLHWTLKAHFWSIFVVDGVDHGLEPGTLQRRSQPYVGDFTLVIEVDEGVYGLDELFSAFF